MNCDCIQESRAQKGEENRTERVSVGQHGQHGRQLEPLLLGA